MISSRWVLTAAHCMDGVKTQKVKVTLGEFDVSTSGETDNTQVVGAEKVFIHEGFDYDTFDNDISLIKLSHDVDLDLFTPVCLPQGDMNKDNADVWITGEVVCLYFNE